jgi:hypothetical protein
MSLARCGIVGELIQLFGIPIFIAYLFWKIFGITTGIVVFIPALIIWVWIFINDLYTKEGRINYKIEKLQKRAIKREIPEKAATVIEYLGSSGGDISYVGHKETHLKPTPMENIKLKQNILENQVLHTKK